MAFTINGFGTKFYGVADLRPDGSFITTEWITAAYIPLIPIRSFRLLRNSAADENMVIVHSKGYVVLETRSLFWPQIARVYSFIVGLALWVIFIGWLFIWKLKIVDRPNAPILFFGFMMVILTPFIAMVWFRREAFRAKHGETKPPRYS